jgi:hypothetical protein
MPNEKLKDFIHNNDEKWSPYEPALYHGRFRACMPK